MADRGANQERTLPELISVRQAIEILDAVPVQPRMERRRLAEAHGLRLAEDLLADRDFPPFDKSQMDGYAVRSADVASVPAELRVTGEILAGQWPERAVMAGEAIAIMTGAPLPPGADGVVPIEDVEHTADGVRVLRAVQPGRYIARRGSDMPAGQIVLLHGTRLGPAQIAVAASVGAANPLVCLPPRVAVLGTGDEIIPIDQSPGLAQIRDSNTAMLVALLTRLGCEVRNLGTVADDLEATRAALVEGMESDALFVTGGMSMGTRDYIPRLLRELGLETRISKLRIKPGKPFVFATGQRGGGEVGMSKSSAEESPSHEGQTSSDEPTSSHPHTLTSPRPDIPTSAHPHAPTSQPYFVFGLPGNPVSAYICTLRLASRLLARLAGGVPEERWLMGRLDVGLPANGPREFYQPVLRLAPPGDRSAQSEIAAIRPLPFKGSADLFTLAAANALLVRAENEPPLAKGTLLRVLDIG